MVDTPSSPSPSAVTRREHRHRARRRRRARVASTTLLVVITFVLGGLVVTDTLRIPRGPGPVLADAGDPRARGAAGVAADPTRLLSPDDPLRLWIAGDSLAGSLGPSLGEMTASTGVVQPTFDSRVSSGLASPDFFDWPEHATDELARLDPEAIAFVIGANDATSFAVRDDWQGDYAAEVRTMMELLVGNGRDVYWVGVPTMAEAGDDSSGREVNAVFLDAVEQFPEVTYVDAYSLFASETGGYISSLPDSDGVLSTMRTDDGVHLTATGGDRLGRAVFYRLDATWDVSGQAVPGVAQRVVQTPGSSQLEGTYRSPPGADGGIDPSTDQPGGP